ncbi:hypothetical protein KSP39_PZI001306 [Platanthera zijinensis]|uniref:Uncharacterized protein n=1 Tax=Platanthera zijinensis TaxID=2320716 RepID=A0AAP0BZD9_9ASPA
MRSSFLQIGALSLAPAIPRDPKGSPKKGTVYNIARLQRSLEEWCRMDRRGRLQRTETMSLRMAAAGMSLPNSLPLHLHLQSTPDIPPAICQPSEQ